jgi:hypothetical protein
MALNALKQTGSDRLLSVWRTGETRKIARRITPVFALSRLPLAKHLRVPVLWIRFEFLACFLSGGDLANLFDVVDEVRVCADVRPARFEVASESLGVNHAIELAPGPILHGVI